MNVVFVLCLLLFSSAVSSYHYPQLSLRVLKSPPATVYYGEELRIPIEIRFFQLRKLMKWYLPAGTRMENISGYCPTVPVAYGEYTNGICSLNLVVPGTTIGRKIKGLSQYYVSGEGSHGHRWAWVMASFPIDITVIPHCPALLGIPKQVATANQSFNLNLKPYIKYYQENNIANTIPQMLVTPAQQGGLHYNASNYTLSGKPLALGTYTFKISTFNAKCALQSTELTIEVKANLKDKPLFRAKPSLVSGFANHKYHMNLVELVQSSAGLMEHNQIHFRIENNEPYPSWLRISPTDTTQLEGQVPEAHAGRTLGVTLVASTNTGGDSAPLRLPIAIGYDPDKKPLIKAFSINSSAGNKFHFDVLNYISNTQGHPVHLYIDKIDPLAPWIEHDNQSLTGLVPLDAVGQLFKITLRASTAAGGSSMTMTVPLQIGINKELTPKLIEYKNLPIATPGQAYFHDFLEHPNVTPSIPYQIELDKNFPNPGWIALKDNKLFIEQVPELYERLVFLYFRITNLPGGTSETIKMTLPLAYSIPIPEPEPEPEQAPPLEPEPEQQVEQELEFPLGA